MAHFLRLGGVTITSARKITPTIAARTALTEDDAALARIIVRDHLSGAGQAEHPTTEWPGGETDTIVERLHTRSHALVELVSDVLAEPEQRSSSIVYVTPLPVVSHIAIRQPSLASGRWSPPS